ncbi:hypothetical protein N9V90_02355, partial [Endozoicomonas sp.]|nr:hypothetical protein [Endozoicomonas sp.]MDB2384659.1 hypothetical protein [Endozoicomonas sp.]
MLLDNRQNGKVGDELRQHLSKGSKLSIISGLFSIYGFDSLRTELAKVYDIRLLLSKPTLITASPLNPFSELTGDHFEQHLKNQLNQQQIAKECARWLKQKVDVKSTSMANQNLFHISKGKDNTFAIQGSSNFTSTGLGFSESDQFDMNMCLNEPSATQGILEWFNA